MKERSKVPELPISGTDVAVDLQFHAEPNELELTILLPCLNEARTIGACIAEAREAIAEHGLAAEVLVADNGSDDDSPQIAKAAGARVIAVAAPGYGSVIRTGVAAARGRFVIMADADGSYDLSKLMPFLERLREGNQLVMGDRFRGGIAPGAMPWLHRWVGNPILSGLGRLFFSARIADFHSGMRGFDRLAMISLELHTSGMEFASEMVIRAALDGFRVANVPIKLRRDGRDRPPHLQTWRDGWRHLRFMLVLSPRWLILYPGLVLMAVAAVLGGLLVAGPVHVGRIRLDIDTLLVAAGAVLLGYQLVGFASFAEAFAIRGGIRVARRPGAPFAWLSLEIGIVLGLGLMAVGIAGIAVEAGAWVSLGFGHLNPAQSMRVLIPSVLALSLGFQTFFGSFFLDLLRMPIRVERRVADVAAQIVDLRH
jgi:glycosyltransferase involved in cell wall biosynthesis